MFASDADMTQVVEEWFQKFKADEASSVADLVNFVLECAGCYSKVDQYDIDDVDNCTSKLTDIQEEFQAVRQVIILDIKIPRLTRYFFLDQGYGVSTDQAEDKPHFSTILVPLR